MKRALITLSACLASLIIQPAHADPFATGPYVFAGASLRDAEGDVDVSARDFSFSGASGLSYTSLRDATGTDSGDATLLDLGAGWALRWHDLHLSAEAIASLGDTTLEAGALSGGGTSYFYNPFGANSVSAIGLGPVPPAADRSVTLKNDYSLRLRAGYVLADKWLAFAGGGFSKRDADVLISETQTGLPATTRVIVDEGFSLEGWSAFAGVEYAVTDTLALRLETGTTRYDGPASQVDVQFPNGAPEEYTRAINYDTIDETNVSLRLVYAFGGR